MCKLGMATCRMQAGHRRTRAGPLANLEAGAAVAPGLGAAKARGVIVA